MRNALIRVFGALGGILWGYGTGVISGALLFIKKDIGLTPLLEGMVVSGLLVGAMLGAGVCGKFSDAWSLAEEPRSRGAEVAVGAEGTAASRRRRRQVRTADRRHNSRGG